MENYSCFIVFIYFFNIDFNNSFLLIPEKLRRKIKKKKEVSRCNIFLLILTCLLQLAKCYIFTVVLLELLFFFF